jgi:hypothetical protein
VTEIVTGDDTTLRLTLQAADGGIQPLSGATSVQVALVSLDRTATLAGPYTAVSTHPDADWTNGLVAVDVPGTDTAALAVTRCEIEVQAVLADGKKRSWVRCYQLPVVVTKGLIP